MLLYFLIYTEQANEVLYSYTDSPSLAQLLPCSTMYCN